MVSSPTTSGGSRVKDKFINQNNHTNPMIKYIILILSLLLFSGCAGSSIAVVDIGNDGQSVGAIDFETACSLDLINGTDCLVLSSHNPDVDNSGGREDLWEAGGRMVYLNTSEFMNITSTSTDDDLGGTGLTTLFMRCLNENLTTTDEIIIMDGTNIVQSTTSCLRPVFIAGVAGGSTQENQGTITATSAETGHIQMQMNMNEGLSKNSQFTVPANHTAIIKQVIFGATKSGGQEPIVELKGKARFLGTSIWVQSFDFKLDTGVADLIVLDQPISNQLVAGTDYRLEVTSSLDNTDVLARTYVIFREND